MRIIFTANSIKILHRFFSSHIPPMSSPSVSPFSLFLTSRANHRSIEFSRYGQFATFDYSNNNNNNSTSTSNSLPSTSIRTVVIRDCISSSVPPQLLKSVFPSSLQSAIFPCPIKEFNEILLFTTDSRSDKCKELLLNPISSLSIEFSSITNEFYEFNGISQLINENNEILAAEQIPLTKKLIEHNQNNKENSMKLKEYLTALRLFHWRQLSPSGRLSFENPLPGTRKANPAEIRENIKEMDYYQPQAISMDQPSKHFYLVFMHIYRVNYTKSSVNTSIQSNTSNTVNTGNNNIEKKILFERISFEPINDENNNVWKSTEFE